MKNLPQLNLPPTDLRISQANGQMCVFDRLRNKFVALTPEEWVRQNFVTWLMDHKGYPAGYIVNETGLRVNGRPRRADSVVYDRCLRPLVVIEYKRPSVAVTQQVFDQIVRYNMAFMAPFLMVSNGLAHYCCLVNFSDRSYRFMREIPEYETIASQYAGSD